MTTTAGTLAIGTTWALLHEALESRQAVRATYQGRTRVLCPHAIGWKNGRTKVLALQTAVVGAESSHPVGWRSMFVDEIEDLAITDDQWRTSDNYTPNTTGIDTLSAAI
jgi:hypothetical protein